MLCCNAVLQCCVAMLCCNAVLQCCVAMLLLPSTFCARSYTCSTVVPRGVIIGMSGESWCHKSTLIIFFRLRHF